MAANRRTVKQAYTRNKFRRRAESLKSINVQVGKRGGTRL